MDFSGVVGHGWVLPLVPLSTVWVGVGMVVMLGCWGRLVDFWFS